MNNSFRIEDNLAGKSITSNHVAGLLHYSK